LRLVGKSFYSRAHVPAEVAIFEDAKKAIDIVSMVFDLTSTEKNINHLDGKHWPIIEQGSSSNLNLIMTLSRQ